MSGRDIEKEIENVAEVTRRVVVCTNRLLGSPLGKPWRDPPIEDIYQTTAAELDKVLDEIGAPYVDLESDDQLSYSQIRVLSCLIIIQQQMKQLRDRLLADEVKLAG